VGGGGGSILIRAKAADVKPVTQGSSPAGAGSAAAEPGTAIGYQVALGGLGGEANSGGAIVSAHSGDIITDGDNTPGVLMQSVGGGGGRAVLDIEAVANTAVGQVALTLGGVGGIDEAGGDVVRSHVGAIQTSGAMSTGAILQSIGGGGGSASLIARQ
jgi:hypothetical protein